MKKDDLLKSLIASRNRLIVGAVTEKVSVIATENYLQQRVQRSDKQAFQRLLAKVPSREVQLDDEL
jgi:hypothetical protein